MEDIARRNRTELSDQAVTDMHRVQDAVNELGALIRECVPADQGRYSSLAITSLEQASMWAVKGITA